MANKPAGRPPRSTPQFDPEVTTARDLRDQPLAVIKTELPALAEALGVTPAELFRALTGEAVGSDAERSVRGARDVVTNADLAAMDIAARPMCCHSDSW
jgi:hypothetical protein